MNVAVIFINRPITVGAALRSARGAIVVVDVQKLDDDDDDDGAAWMMMSCYLEYDNTSYSDPTRTKIVRAADQKRLHTIHRDILPYRA
jgi:hypothetical protein